MRLRHGLVQREHGSTGYPLLFQSRNGGVPRRERFQPSFQDVGDQPVVVASGARGSESWVVFELRHAKGLDHLRPLMSQRANDDELAPAAIEHTDRATVRVQ